MNEFYQIMTSLFVIIGVSVAIGFIITFSPIENTVKLIRKYTKSKRIKNARSTIERYQPHTVLTESEIKSLVLEYLDENGMIVTSGGCPYGY